MKKWLTITAALVTITLIGAACQKNTKNENSVPADENAGVVEENVNLDEGDGTAVRENVNAFPSDNSNGNKNVNARNSNENVNVPVNYGAITVEQPKKDDNLTSPFTVKGTAQGSTVFVRVKNAAGDTMFTEPVQVRTNAFSISLTFDVSHSTTGTIEVFDKDASGNAQNLTVIPVSFVVGTADVNLNTNTNINENTNGNSNENENLNENTNVGF
ncbi:MAG: Gmad2 immunoglobulin-like domain-containing protein [Candidatus Kerfeldbacteria bacterium]